VNGAPGYLQANLDDIDLSFHDSSASLGHDVEICVSSVSRTCSTEDGGTAQAM
jgi:hypothetical protein